MKKVLILAIAALLLTSYNNRNCTCLERLRGLWATRKFGRR